jgi:hypothetical protein
MYLAWDVGVKNLAYCLTDKKGNIVKWDIINLTNQRTIKCDGINKNGSDCSSQSMGFDNKSKHFYCKKHMKDKTCKDLYVCFECNTKCKYIHKIQNIYCCAKHLPEKDQCEYSEVINNKNVTKTSLSKLGNNLIDKLDDIPELLQATTIDIENQPALKNPTMKSVQMILYTYFLINLKNKKYSLNLVSARNKLKFDLENEDIKETKKITDNYKKNKKLAIDFTREFLKNTPDWLEYFENYKNKKDDLADAYLMIRYRLKTI